MNPFQDQIQRQQSLPVQTQTRTDEETSVKETLFASAQKNKFDVFREKFSKLRDSKGANSPVPAPPYEGRSSQNMSFTHGLAKILHRWKSEQEPEQTQLQTSFTRKKGVNIDPIVVFGLRRDQSLDSATRRGLFHKKGAWSPKSPKLDTQSPLDNPCLLSPTVRRCCMECPEDNGVVERRLSRGEAGSDGSKESSIQSDTSLDSEDSCISVIFVPHPEHKSQIDGTKQSPQSQRSTSNSSESSDSPTGRASPMSPGGKVMSPSKNHAKGKLSKLPAGESHLTMSNNDAEKGSECKEKDQIVCHLSNKPKHFVTSMLPRIPEHKSFELEDLPSETPINCHPVGLAERVESLVEKENSQFSEQPEHVSRFNYPIVKHHPLFAKSRKVRSGISSLLVGENIEFSRKQGQSSSQGVQTVRKGTPKLLTFEIYNPETDDLDSDTSHSCSSDSEESVVSVISDSSKIVRSTEAIIQSEENHNGNSDSDIIFNFESEANNDNKLEEETQVENNECKEEMPYDFRERERKSEKRKKCLMSLLGENKNILENINESQIKCSNVQKVVMKTAIQLQSMEELRLPIHNRSESSSPEIKECKSEPIIYANIVSHQHDSLDSISSICEQTRQEAKEEANHSDQKEDFIKEVEDPLIEEPKKSGDKSKSASLLKMKQINKKFDDDSMPEIVISDASDSQLNTVPEQNGSLNSNIIIQTESPKHKVSDENHCDIAPAESEKDKSISESPSPKSLEEKCSESSVKLDTEGQSSVHIRRKERKKREDSLDSNTPSIKSSIYHSDTGSVLSHRFSTISISSNVSSDVSFGNTSGVSGSSCYLASMSSADFDDRPPLASSFSLSEAEENEYLSRQASQDQEAAQVDNSNMKTEPIVQGKKDQLSPPKAEPKSQDRPKLKSLFKRSSHSNDSKSRNSSYESKKSLQSSYEGRSREGGEDGMLSKPRSRIGSSLTPETSLEQTTCVERCASSFEEELMRSFNKDDNEKDLGSESDSEDSAEAGGSLTHHRYYHVFREGEINHIIEKYVENLHIISSYYDHANWCVVAEKVNVWTI